MSTLFVSREEASQIRQGRKTQYRTDHGFKYLNRSATVWELAWYEREKMYALAYKPDPSRLIPVKCVLGKKNDQLEIVVEGSGEVVGRAKIKEAKPQRLREIQMADLMAEGLSVGDSLEEDIARYIAEWDKQHEPPHTSEYSPWTWKVHFELLEIVQQGGPTEGVVRLEPSGDKASEAPEQTSVRKVAARE